ncbi:unnamed protein product [Gongylonema pulchrum]|uniref:Uncharacterized protein n=1 Tax=Gongylonema pulchrum TaxID=637853 RepID=A0A183DLU2_9BILA|nr:unnamed protein product [Gongylonema pulchrum]
MASAISIQNPLLCSPYPHGTLFEARRYSEPTTLPHHFGTGRRKSREGLLSVSSWSASSIMRLKLSSPSSHFVKEHMHSFIVVPFVHR